MINRLLLVNAASVSVLSGAIIGTDEWIIIICHLVITLFLIAISPVVSILIESRLKIESYLLIISYLLLIITLKFYYNSDFVASVSLFIIIGYFIFCLWRVKLKKTNISEQDLIKKSFFRLLLDERKQLLLIPSLTTWVIMNIILSFLSSI